MVTLAECCLSHPSQTFGLKISLSQHRIRLDALLFGETPSRVVISVATEHLDKVTVLAEERKVPLTLLGQVTEDNHFSASISDQNQHITSQFTLPVADLGDPWRHALTRQLGIRES